MATISSGVNPYLAAYKAQTSPVSGSPSVASGSSQSAPPQSSVSVSLSANSLALSTMSLAAAAPANGGILSVSGNTLTVTDLTGGLNPGDVVRVYDGTREITSKFSGYQTGTTPAGLLVATAGTLSTVANPQAFNGKTSSNLSFTVSKLNNGIYDPESVKSNVVAATLDTIPPAQPRATQGTGPSSRTITLTAPEANTTVEIWNGDPANNGVQVYGGGASDTFVNSGLNQYSAKTGAYNGTETLNLYVRLRDAAGNLSQLSTPLTGKIDSLDRTAATNAQVFKTYTKAYQDYLTALSQVPPPATPPVEPKFSPIDIVDRAVAIVNNIDVLGDMVNHQINTGGTVPAIKLSDSRPPVVLSLTSTQIANNASALNLLTSSQTPPVAFSIDAQGSFTAAQFLSLPQALVDKIKSVKISMSASEAVTNLDDINARLSTEILKPGMVSKYSVDVSDTVQAVQDNFDQIAKLKTITSVKLTDQFVNPTGKTIPLVLKAEQLKSTESAQVNFRAITAPNNNDLTLTLAGLTLTVKKGKTLSANDVAKAFSGTPPADPSVATLAGSLTGYIAVGQNNSSVVTFNGLVKAENVADLVATGTATKQLSFIPAITIAQGGVDLSIINKLPVNFVARVLEAKAKDAQALQNNAHVVDFTVQDTVDQVLLNAKALNTIPKSFTMTIKDTTGNLAARTNNLGTITKPYTLDLTDATVDKVLQFGKQLKSVKAQFSIKDTVANVLAKSTDLSAIRGNFSIADANNMISNDGISVQTVSGMTLNGVTWGDAQFADASDQVKQIVINSPIDTIYKSDNPDTFGHVDILKSISKVLKVNILVDSNTTADQISMLDGISDVPGLDIAPASDIPASILNNTLIKTTLNNTKDNTTLETNPANLVINGVAVSIQMPTDASTVSATINTAVDDYNTQIIAHNQSLMSQDKLDGLMVNLHAEVGSNGRVTLYSNKTSVINVQNMSSIIPFTGLNLGVSGVRVSGVPMVGPSGAMKGVISIDSGLVATTTAKNNAVVALNPGAVTTAKVTFSALKSGESVTLAGLTYKANVDMAKEDVAAAFANIADTTVYTSLTSATGVFSGTMTGWSTGAVTGAVVDYTATKAPSLINLTLGREPSKNMTAICKAINDANIGVKATNDSTVAGGITLTSTNQTPISISNPVDLESWLGLKMGKTSKALQFDCTDAYALPSLKDAMSSLRNFYTLNVIDTQANIDANRAALDQAGRNNVMLTVKA